MSDSNADLDKLMKSISGLIDGCFSDLQKIAKSIEAAQAEKEKAEQAKQAADKKAQDENQKKAEEAANNLKKAMLSQKFPPKLDPTQAAQIPKLISKYIDKNGVRLSDTVSVQPDIDFDPKKMQLKKFELKVTITFP